MRGGHGLLLLMALALPACGGDGALPAVDARIRVHVDRTSVRPGEGMDVKVVRLWRKDHEPAPFHASALAPLSLRDERIERREDALRVQETRRYRAYVFGLEDVVLPALAFVCKPRAGGTPVVAHAAAVPLRVRPVLDPEAPGAPEGPGTPPAPRWAWAVALLAVVGLFEITTWGRARRRGRQRARALDDARGRLAGLTPEAAYLPAAIDVVRDHLTLVTGVLARARTSVELLHVLSGAAATDYRALAAAADAAKFDRQTPEPRVVARAWAAAERLAATTPDGGTA